MIMEVYTVLDRGVKAYLPPFFCRSRGEALRSFTDAVNNREHQFFKHATDYSLWLIGRYDDDSARLEACEPERVVTALEVLVDDVLPPDRRRD